MTQAFFSSGQENGFPVENCPYGIISSKENKTKRVAVKIADKICDLAGLLQAGLLEGSVLSKESLITDSLNPLMALPKAEHEKSRKLIQALLSGEDKRLQSNSELCEQVLYEEDHCELHMPVAIRDYTDFYSSLSHATNVGKMFRPDNPLLPNWKHIPVAYHGRASSVIVSPSSVKRPHGQVLNADGEPTFSATQRLDIELEFGFFIGQGNQLGEPVAIEDAEDHIFGFTLVNDWSARDIQKWEYVPLGPFLAKSFATSISPWVTPMSALEPFRVVMPVQDPKPLPYLTQAKRETFDIELQVCLKTAGMSEFEVIATSNYQNIYWSMAQQLAHHTVNGCNLNTGDLLASGTISGDSEDSFGSLLELTWAGKKPLSLSNGETRVFLQDGDEICLCGRARKEGLTVELGKVTGQITS